MIFHSECLNLKLRLSCHSSCPSRLSWSSQTITDPNKILSHSVFLLPKHINRDIIPVSQSCMHLHAILFLVLFCFVLFICLFGWFLFFFVCLFVSVTDSTLLHVTVFHKVTRRPQFIFGSFSLSSFVEELNFTIYLTNMLEV